MVEEGSVEVWRNLHELAQRLGGVLRIRRIVAEAWSRPGLQLVVEDELVDRVHTEIVFDSGQSDLAQHDVQPVNGK